MLSRFYYQQILLKRLYILLIVTFTIKGTTLGRLTGSNNPLRASSANAKHPPCHEPSPYKTQVNLRIIQGPRKYRLWTLLKKTKSFSKGTDVIELHTSPGENNSSTEDSTSSARADVKRAVIRPIPFAADHRTTVSCIWSFEHICAEWKENVYIRKCSLTSKILLTVNYLAMIYTIVSRLVSDTMNIVQPYHARDFVHHIEDMLLAN